jgi:hypothetical protein
VEQSCSHHGGRDKRRDKDHLQGNPPASDITSFH